MDTAIAAREPKALAADVRNETLRAWLDYRRFAWGQDVLRPISRQGYNWYEESLGISPFDAYSTLIVMELNDEASEVEDYALTTNWQKDVYAEVFEVNIRILGGLLSMYQYSENPAILDLARDFCDRLLPAFDSPTGIPFHSVNLKTGETAGDNGKGAGDIVNVAQATSYLFEFGILSYYTKDPTYYLAAKKATLAVYERRSEIGLVGEYINVRTGEWEGTRWSHLQAGVDSYYEYMYKSWLLFADPQIKAMWDDSIDKIERYLGEEYDGQYFYTIVDMESGEVMKRSVSLYDAFFPSVQALSGNVAAAERNQCTWHWLWRKYGLLPTRYDYDTGEVTYPSWDLNPEIIESAYYLHQITGDDLYLDMIRTYWGDIQRFCRHDVGYHGIADIRTMTPLDTMATFFIAETLKYLYIAFGGKDVFDFDAHVFSTEAHPFRRSDFDAMLAKERLGIDTRDVAIRRHC